MGERQGEGKRFVLVSTVPDVEMMKGTKAKMMELPARAGWSLSEGGGCHRGWMFQESSQTQGVPHGAAQHPPSIPGAGSILGFPNSAPALSQIRVNLSPKQHLISSRAQGCGCVFPALSVTPPSRLTPGARDVIQKGAALPPLARSPLPLQEEAAF